ncbi:MarR family winged helix-turn-helix transcriptional regulator [Geodermatophilus marinus]|uniref:MarR family winged helix-turn-helix transcriptional regulator n=1 Tax=Geodermatophilus sp. LHW52908 TaxID=2303986 RepID=UPI0018F6F03C|nr:MarR family transcriptional regulator [Geodermatophilus sp. LHW52908]
MDDVLTAYRLLVADVYELAGTSRRTSEAIAAGAGQTAARWHVLSVLSDAPRTAAGTARRLGLARQSVQRVADDLVAAGLLARAANPDHRPAPLLSVTDEGAGRSRTSSGGATTSAHGCWRPRARPRPS